MTCSTLISSICCLVASVALAAGQVSASDRFRAAHSAQLSADERIATQEKRLKEEPNSPAVQATLASAFIQKMRETTDFAYLNRAAALVDKMLAADPVSYDGLRLSAEIETHRHNFPRAAELATQLIKRNPSDAGAMGMLGDSLMELGQYDAAGQAYERMVTIAPNLTGYNRVAYHRFVTGDGPKSIDWMASAVQAGSPTAENLAWCLVEFGDMLFKTGRTADAHIAYNRALETLSGYHRANAALGREFAAAAKFKEAEASFLKAQAVIPLPEYAGALESIYVKLGKTAEAEQQRNLVDVIDRLGRVNGEKGNRSLALVYANENRNPDRALEWIRGELDTRRDVYTYDALSWVLFRGGEQKDAEDASRKALAMHTPEPMFFYHAGVIAMAGGDERAGKELLTKALELNPEFSYPEALDAKERLGSVRGLGAPLPDGHGSAELTAASN
jgi:tetratricopeptide (TPR) repeat protein